MAACYRLHAPAPMSSRADGLSNDQATDGVDRDLKWTSSVGGIAGWLQVIFGSGVHQSEDAKRWREHPLLVSFYLRSQG